MPHNKTKLSQAEELHFLREKVSQLEHLYRHAPVGLCCLDTALRYTHINEWLAQLNGPSVEHHLGRTIEEVLPEVAQGVAAQLRRLMDTGEPIIRVLNGFQNRPQGGHRHSQW